MGEGPGASALLLTKGSLLAGKVRFAQPARGYRSGIDPVFLASWAEPCGRDVLDAGAGAGAAALCLLHRCSKVRLCALERDPELAEIAALNGGANGHAERLEVICGDLFDPPAALRQRQFDTVITNPPYHRRDRATGSVDKARRAANLEEVDLADWLAACSRRLKPRGTLHLVFPAARLDDVCLGLASSCGDLVIQPLHTSADDLAASRILVRGRKGARGGVRLLEGLRLHDTGGTITRAARRVLEDGMALAAVRD